MNKTLLTLALLTITPVIASSSSSSSSTQTPMGKPTPAKLAELKKKAREQRKQLKDLRTGNDTGTFYHSNIQRVLQANLATIDKINTDNTLTLHQKVVAQYNSFSPKDRAETSIAKMEARFNLLLKKP